MNIEVANRLAQLRKIHGLSQEQLAEKLNISRQAVSKWERAESSPDTDNLIALSRLYQVSLDELVITDPDSEDDLLFARSEASVRRDAQSEESASVQDVIDDYIKIPRSASGAINWKVFPYPVIVAVAYLLIGLFFDLWHPGWMLFLTIPMYYTAIAGDHFDLNHIPYPLLVAVMYLIIGFAWDLWHPGWLIFLTIPLYYTIMGRRIKGSINLVLIALMALCVFSMLGFAVAGWGRWLISALGAVLVVTGVVQTLSR